MSFGQGGPGGGTPDWAALAADTAARDRRRKLLMIGGGMLAAGGVAAIVATAIVRSDGNGGGGGTGGKQAAGASAPASSGSPGTPEPTFAPVAPPPPQDPRAFISSAEKDKAPLTTGTLFPDAKPTLSGRTYERTATAATTDCASVTQGALGSVLSSNGCRQVLRATYVRDGVAVTVGVAVFDTKAAADKAKAQSTGNIAALPGDGAAAFCRATACRLTANAEGRYAYFTVAGNADNSPVTAGERKALDAGRDVSTYAFGRILARGRAAAAAAAASSVTH
ncbi:MULTISPECIES: hypothetical protein [Streptomyces]|uniref:hypothetical protein n=1 Tax=Streptomyces TaxID=1883 RepID=UPI00163D0A4C|nr:MULTISPECIES: hypothetical protein [Streptomyces]MBC2875916.1 hypothetical protein [Streptomyces sp. TYQ1024]UBI38289.1 hypothetical protein K7I03_18715 [Streptomyces mobaraensis]UKW30874.1 hypothetical protein MCU78_18670 [Streptomyces sp. TYQ1024]